MPSAITVKVDLKGLNVLEPKVRGAIGKGLDKTGRDIERDAKIMAPVDTGRLRASISPTRKGFILRVIANVHYAIYQELGTRFMRGRHYMKKALEKNISKIPRNIVNEIRRVLR